MKKWIPLLLVVLLVFAATPSTAEAIGAGDTVKVSWKGKWYDAVIRKVSGTRFYIHYTGYDNSWDEWVTAKRMKIQVRWQGKWYKAKALKSGRGKVLIHYTGYDSSWDEWVTLNRIAAYGVKKRRKRTRRNRVPSHIRESARDVPSDPMDFLKAIERNRGR